MIQQEALIYYSEHPYEFVCDFIDFTSLPIKKPTFQQKQVLDTVPIAIKENKHIAVKSGHGTGKTATESWIILWAMATRPEPIIPCTAPTERGLFDVLWKELSKWHDRFLLKNMFEWTRTRFQHKIKSQTWFATARTSNKPENMQGFHAEHLIFIVDEASGVMPEILEAIEGSQTQSGSIIIYFGNPTQIAGGFYDAFNTKRAFYYTFTFNSEDSPLVKKEYYEQIAAKYGRDSDFYRVRVLGEFPQAEPDTLIPLNIIESSIIKKIEERPYEIVEIGADIARFGDDESDVYSRINDEIKEECTFHKRDLMYVTGQIVQVIKKYHDTKTVIVNVDDTGLGGGVTDRLNELVSQGVIRAEICGVNNGSRAFDSDTYQNLGTEMWFFMKEWLKTGKIPNDNDLVAQLSSRKYKISSSGKNMLEPKDMMKKRGLTSPDRADGAILTLRSLISGFSEGNRAFAC